MTAVALTIRNALTFATRKTNGGVRLTVVIIDR